MAGIDFSTTSTPLNDGVLQLQNGVAMDSTLRNVADQLNTTSPLKLSTAGVQVESTLQITTNSNPYIDAEDGAGNNRFQVGRDPSSQVVNVDFASNPTGGTNMVGGIRTYTDGVNLAQVMSFRKDGYIGINRPSPNTNLDVNGQINAETRISVAGASWSSGTNLGGISIYSSNVGGFATATYNYASGAGFAHCFVTGAANRLFINDAGVGVNSINPTAKLQVVGGGSTSATTSLLVQNSGGTDLVRVQDNGVLTLGTFASGLGKIVVTCDPSYGTKSVMENNFGGTIIRQVSTDTLYFGGQAISLLTANNYLVLTAPYISGNSISAANSGACFKLQLNVNSYGASAAAPARGIQIYGDLSLQAAGYVNAFEISPTFNFDTSAGRIAKGIYYNPDVSSIKVGDVHYGIQTTSGGAYINTTTPQASACLQADSTTQGFLPPRMTDAQIRAIVAPTNGLVAYNTDINHLCCYQAGAWVKFSHTPM